MFEQSPSGLWEERSTGQFSRPVVATAPGWRLWDIGTPLSRPSSQHPWLTLKDCQLSRCGERQTQAGANKKLGQEQREHCAHSSENATPRKWALPVRHAGSSWPTGQNTIDTIVPEGSMHPIVTAVMTSVTEQDKRHLVPKSWIVHVIEWPTCHFSPFHVSVRFNVNLPWLHCPVLRITQLLHFCLFSNILKF